MTTINETVWREWLGEHNHVSVVYLGTDAERARMSYEGTEREWQEFLKDVGVSPKFYAVICSLNGAYLADSCEVYASKKEAIAGAKWYVDNYEDEQEQEQEANDND